MWDFNSCLGRESDYSYITVFSGELDSIRLTVWLDDLKGLFQPKWFCDSPGCLWVAQPASAIPP